MDSLSVWINNHQLLDRIESEDLLSVQDVIIQNVFGGFDKLLLDLMKNYNQLSLEKQMKIYNILLNKYDNDIYNNCKSKENNKLSIFDVSDDCLIHIMKFLNDNDIYSMQQTSRLFTIISRNEAIFATTNEYQNYFNLGPFGDEFSRLRCMKYGITPNKHLIINGLLSDDTEIRQSSINHLATMIRCGDYKCFIDIKNYSKSLQVQLQNDILEDVVDNKDCMTIFLYDFEKAPTKHSLLILSKILGHAINCDAKDDIFKDLTRIFHILSRVCKRFMFDIMSNKELLSVIISLLSNHTRFTETKQILNIGAGILKKILSFGCDTHKTTLFENGIMKIFKPDVILWYNHRKLTSFLKALTFNITAENLKIIVDDDEGSREILTLIKKNDMKIIADVFKLLNYEQREILIDHMIEIKMFNRSNRNRSYVEQIMNMLDEQTSLHAKFKSAFYSELETNPDITTSLFLNIRNDAPRYSVTNIASEIQDFGDEDFGTINYIPHKTTLQPTMDWTDSEREMTWTDGDSDDPENSDDDNSQVWALEAGFSASDSHENDLNESNQDDADNNNQQEN